MDSARSDLDLLRRVPGDQLTAVYASRQVVIVQQDSVGAQNVRNEVVGKDSQTVQIIEVTRALSTESDGEVSGGELRPLVERSS